MTEDEVRQLYRALLGREPEDSGTVAAFTTYYPTIERGRRAIFGSAEFQAFFARATGRSLAATDPLASALALALLARAGAASPLAVRPAQDAALRHGMQLLFPAAGPRLAVVVGEHPTIALADLLPLADPQSAILQVAPGLPPAVPLTSTLADGTALFRLGGDAASTNEVLRGFGRPVAALCLLGHQAGPHWLEVLRPHLAARALVVADGPEAPSVGAAIARSRMAEPVQAWHGLQLHHAGGWLLPVTYAPPAAPPPPPDRSAYPSLAVAAIVRDEAACVANMLASARPVASFYAVLDTGSVDGTPDLARSCLQGCGVPFALAQRDHTAFDDDFAAMRNAALAMVPDWIDWVLMLDADEQLVAEDHAGLLELIRTGEHEVFALPRYNFPGADCSGALIDYPDRQARLLRNRPGDRILYRGVVHETIPDIQPGRPPLDASAMGGPRGGPHIHHLVRRFRNAEREARKQAFYRDVARRHGG